MLRRWIGKSPKLSAVKMVNCLKYEILIKPNQKKIIKVYAEKLILRSLLFNRYERGSRGVIKLFLDHNGSLSDLGSVSQTPGLTRASLDDYEVENGDTAIIYHRKQACLSLPLNLSLAEDTPGLPGRQLGASVYKLKLHVQQKQ